MSTFARRLTTLAAVIAALSALLILVSIWAIMGGIGEALDDDNASVVVQEATCTTYASDVMDLHAQGYTAQQITQTFRSVRAEGNDTPFLFHLCGTPHKVLAAAGPLEK